MDCVNCAEPIRATDRRAVQPYVMPHEVHAGPGRMTVTEAIESGPCHAECLVPDTRDPSWAGFIGPDTDLSRFEVAPPASVRAIVR